MTRGVRVKVQSEYSPDQSAPSKNQWFFLYTVTIANEGARDGSTADAALDHHRRHRPHRRGSRSRRGRQAADTQARRFVRVHLRLPAADAVRGDGRHLSDGDTGRRPVRREDRAVHAQRTVYGPLTGNRSSLIAHHSSGNLSSGNHSSLIRQSLITHHARARRVQTTSVHHDPSRVADRGL